MRPMTFVVAAMTLAVLCFQLPSDAGATGSERARERGGAYYPGGSAIDFEVRYRIFDTPLTDAGGKNRGGAPQPPVEPSPGDERTEEWSECGDPGPCTRYSRTDRYQRRDAPTTAGSDPARGAGALGWVPVSWKSWSCAAADLCMVEPAEVPDPA